MIISLLEKHEATELGLDHEGEVARSHNINFTSFPIPDRGVPAATHEPLSVLLLRRIGAALEEGNNVAVDRRQGVGPSGLIAAGVLVATGTGWEKAIDTVSTSRGLSIPETR
jgi:hypothetical protein